MVSDIKEVLYSVISEVGKDRIRADLFADIDAASKKYCETIIDRCTKLLGVQTDDETLGTLCEALLHFMLTASLLPSERKVIIHDTELDIVVPSVKNLTRDSSKALVIQVVKNNDISRVVKAEKVQPNQENLWIISARPLEIGHRNYSLRGNYPSIIKDIHLFLQEKRISSLRMLHD